MSERDRTTMGQDQLKTRSLKFHQDNRGRVQSKEVQQKTFVTPVAEAAEQLVSEGEAVEAAAIKTQIVRLPKSQGNRRCVSNLSFGRISGKSGYSDDSGNVAGSKSDISKMSTKDRNAHGQDYQQGIHGDGVNVSKQSVETNLSSGRFCGQIGAGDGTEQVRRGRSDSSVGRRSTGMQDAHGQISQSGSKEDQGRVSGILKENWMHESQRLASGSPSKVRLTPLGVTSSSRMGGQAAGISEGAYGPYFEGAADVHRLPARSYLSYDPAEGAGGVGGTLTNTPMGRKTGLGKGGSARTLDQGVCQV